MKIAVVGSRGWEDYARLEWVLDKYPASELVSGAAQGADRLAEVYAIKRRIPITIYEPNMTGGYDVREYHKRNQNIVENCDKLVAFWDGKSAGTRGTIERARRAGKLLEVVTETPQAYQTQKTLL
jgi:hypothetical protein